ncbi:MAG: DUF4034 domain-containing protein [Opitutaceae bacterium]|jgi:hypothetical protein
MNKTIFLLLTLSLGLGALTGCKKPSSEKPVAPANPSQSLQRVKDPILEEIYAFRVEIRQAYNNRRFDELETKAAELRTSKALFENGTWKISKFYSALACSDDEPESMWQLHDRIHQDWITAKPGSITARVAYADFLARYAWQARGSDYANTVKKEGWRLFEERLEAARTVLAQARALPEKDPMWWRVSLTVALGQGWPKPAYDALVKEAKSAEPGFWEYDTARAYSLLPRWYGEEGDCEAYASEAAENPAGLGPEIYARIVLNLFGYHQNIFKDSAASWPKTRAGLEQMRQKYPKSLEFLNCTAMLASLAGDREFAKTSFDALGNTYLPSAWNGDANKFLRCKKWAETGR